MDNTSLVSCSYGDKISSKSSFELQRSILCSLLELNERNDSTFRLSVVQIERFDDKAAKCTQMISTGSCNIFSID